MTNQAWTTQQLIHFSNAMSSAFGGNRLGSQSSGLNSDTWTTEKLLHMSRSLSQGYHPGL